LKFDKVLGISDSIKTCPVGYVWEVQSILNHGDYLKEDFKSSFLSGLKNESEMTYYERYHEKKIQIWLNGQWFVPASFPFMLEAGDKVSSGHKKRFVIIAQYKIE
jgi:hypothetical protein